jgi:hypothetical protein
MSVEEIRTKNRRKELSRIYRSKEWKDAVKSFITGKRCEWCGTTENLLAHHPDTDCYRSEGLYIDLILSRCVVLCRRCHFHLHHGRVLCTKCKEHYHGLEYDQCWHCLSPDIKEKQEVRKIMYKKRQKEYRKKKYLELKERYGK